MMKTIVPCVAALSFIASAALAQQPVQLTSEQMDKVTAGFLEIDVSNTSATAVSRLPEALSYRPDAEFYHLPWLLSVDQQPNFQCRCAIRANLQPGHAIRAIERAKLS